MITYVVHPEFHHMFFSTPGVFVFPGIWIVLSSFFVTDLEASARGLTEVADCMQETWKSCKPVVAKPCFCGGRECRLHKNSKRQWNQAMRKS